MRINKLRAVLLIAVLIISFASWGQAQTIRIETRSHAFIVGDVEPQAADEVRIIASDSSALDVGQSIALRIPSNTPLQWVIASEVSVSGLAENKVANLRFQDNKNFLLDITEAWSVGDEITIAGLRLVDISRAASAVSLSLFVGDATSSIATSDSTWRIGNPLIDISPQGFVVNDPATDLGTVVVRESETAAGLSAGRELSLVLPSDLAMTWDTSVDQISLSGSEADNLSNTIVYSADARTATLSVIGAFSAGGVVALDGLKVANFDSTSQGPIGLIINEQPRVSVQELRVGNPSLEIVPQGFVVNDPASELGAVVVRESSSVAGLSAGRELRLVLPAALAMVWDTSVAQVRLSGTDADKVGVSVSYAPDARVAVLSVVGDFTAGGDVSIEGLQVANFTAVSPNTPIELWLGNSQSHSSSESMLRIGAPVLELSAERVFVVGDIVDTLGVISIVESDLAAGITAGRRLQIRLPESMSIEWDRSFLNPTLTGSGAGRVDATSFAYTDGRTVELTVREDFSPGDQLVISGLRVANLTIPSLPDRLTLILNEANQINGRSEEMIAIAQVSILTAANQGFTVADNEVALSDITITDDARVAGISAGRQIRIQLPDAARVTWNTDQLPNIVTEVSGRVGTPIFANDRALVIPVEADFNVGETIRVSGLLLKVQNTQPRISLQLSLNSESAVNSEDDKWIEVGQPLVRSQRDHVFALSRFSGRLFAISVQEDPSAASITPQNGIQLHIPDDSFLRWGETTAAGNIALNAPVQISGQGASKIAAQALISSDGRSLQFDVLEPFEPGDSLVISGLPVHFEQVSPPVSIQLLTSPGVDASDAFTARVGAPMVSFPEDEIGVRDTLFVVGDEAKELPSLEIQEDGIAPAINVQDGLTIILPNGFTGSWQANTAVLTGSAADKVAPVGIDDFDGTMLHLDVLQDFAAGDNLVVGGLVVGSFEGAASRDSLSVRLLAQRAEQAVFPLAVGAPELSSLRDQAFVVFEDGVGDEEATLVSLTISESELSRSIISAEGIRLIIPDELPVEWVAADPLRIVLSGGAAAKVSGFRLINAKVMEIAIDEDFAAGERLTIDSLQIRNITQAAAPTRVVLSTTAGRSMNAIDDHTKRVGNPSLLSATQQRFLSETSGQLAEITISEDPIASSIESSFTLRLPADFDATWSTNLTPTLPSGTALVEQSEKDLVFSVDQPLAAAGQLTIAGLRVDVGAETSIGARLILSVNGGSDALDAELKRISGHPTLSLANDLRLAVDDPDTTVRISVVDDPSSPAIIAGEDILIALPPGLNVRWIDTQPVPGGSAAGRMLSTELDVTGKTWRVVLDSDFVAGDILTLDVTLTGVDGISLPQRIVLSVQGDTLVHEERSTQRISIGHPEIASQEDQVFIAGLDDQDGRLFAVGDQVVPGPAPCAPLTISEHPAVGTISAENGIRIIIPDTLAMFWEQSVDEVLVAGNGSVNLPSTTPNLADGSLVFEDSKTVFLRVVSDFAPGDSLRLEGLRLQGFASSSRRAPLLLSVNGGRSINDRDERTKRVGSPSIGTTASQRFTIGEGDVGAAPLFIIEDEIESAITVRSGIEIRLSEKLAVDNLLFRSAAADIVFSGNAVTKVGVATLAADGKSLRIEVIEDFAPGDTLVVAGSELGQFNEVVDIKNLFTLSVTPNIEDGFTAQSGRIGDLQFAMGQDQIFLIKDLPQAIADVVITENAAVGILSVGDTIHLEIPATAALSWVGPGRTINVERPRLDVVMPEPAVVDAPTVSPQDALGTPLYSEDGKLVSFVLLQAPEVGSSISIAGLNVGQFIAKTNTNVRMFLSLAGADDGSGRLQGRFTRTDANSILVGRPQLASAESQAFFVGETPVEIVPITFSQDPDWIAFGDRELRIYIPSAMAAEWDDSRDILDLPPESKLNNAVRYEADENGRVDVAIIELNDSLNPGESVVISGLALQRLARPSADAQLSLSLNGGETIQIRDSASKRIGNPVMTVRDAVERQDGLRDTMVFIARSVISRSAGVPSTEIIYPLSIVASETAAALIGGDMLRVRIPTAFSARWVDDGAGLRVGTWGENETPYANAKLSFAGVEESGEVLLLAVEEDWEKGDSTVVENLRMDGFASAAGNESLVMEIRDRFRQASKEKMRVGAPILQSDSGDDEVYVVGDPSSAKRGVLIAESDVAAGIVADRDIRLAVPDGLDLQWNIAAIIENITFSGSTGIENKISRDISFESDDRILVIPVLRNFAPGDLLEIDGLSVSDFGSSSTGNLELWPQDDGRYAISDPAALYVGAPRLYSADSQVFVVGDNATELLPIAVIDDERVATIRKGGQLRIVLPPSLNATWSELPIAPTGSGSDKVGAISFDGDTLRVPVERTFALGDTLLFAGLELMDFTNSSPPDRLGLTVTSSGYIHTYDEEEKWVGKPIIRAEQELALALDLTAEMGDRKGEQDPQDLTFTIVEDAIASSIRGDSGVLLTLNGGLGEYLEWDLSGLPELALNGINISNVGTFSRDDEDAAVLHVSVDREILDAGDELRVSGLRLRAQDEVYSDLALLAERLPIEDAVGLIVHGDSDSLHYQSAAIPNANKNLIVGSTETPIELFLPLALDRPRLFSDSDGTWMAFHTAPRMLDAAQSLRREQFQLFRHSVSDEALFVEPGLAPIVAEHLDFKARGDVALALDEVRILLTPSEIKRANRWFDNSSLGEGDTQIELRIREGVGLVLKEGAFVDRAVSTRTLHDPENSAVHLVGYMGLVAPDSVAFPLAQRYFDPWANGEPTEETRIGELHLGAESRALGQLIIQNYQGSDSLAVEDVVIEQGAVTVPRVLPEGASQLDFYFRGEGDTLSFPILRQVVIDTTAPQIARASGTDGRSAKTVIDSVDKPELRQVRADTINALSPISGLDRLERGLPITSLDTLRTKVIDNLYIPATRGDEGPVSADHLQIWRGGEIATDSLYFRMPIHAYPFRLAFTGSGADGASVQNIEVPDTFQSELAQALGLDTSAPIFGSDPVLAQAQGDTFYVDLSMPARFDFSQPPLVIWPFSLLPGVLLVDGVQLAVSVVITDGAGHSTSLNLGGEQVEYLVRTGEFDGLLVNDMINFPNPFASLQGVGNGVGTTIRFVLTPQLADRAEARLKVFDSGGELVYVAELNNLGAGEHALTWPGYSLYGQALATGVYFAILEVRADGQTEVNRHTMAILNR
jgi:hypothetical protein